MLAPIRPNPIMPSCNSLLRWCCPPCIGKIVLLGRDCIYSQTGIVPSVRRRTVWADQAVEILCWNKWPNRHRRSHKQRGCWRVEIRHDKLLTHGEDVIVPSGIDAAIVRNDVPHLARRCCVACPTILRVGGRLRGFSEIPTSKIAICRASSALLGL